MAQEVVNDNLQAKTPDVNVNENEKTKEKKDRNRPPTKIVIRRLPPSMTEETFREQVSPVPDHDYLYFVKADLGLGPSSFSRAYINFLKQEDIILFKDQYDGYVFVDKTGNEYPAVVEFAPFQRLPKKRAIRRRDVKAGTIEDDPMYINFLQSIEDEIKDKENEHAFDYSYKPVENDDKKVTTTPLLEYLKQRRAERQRSREERKEDRRKKERERELEKRKLRDEEKKRSKRPDIKDKDKDTVPGTSAVKQVLRNVHNEKEGAVNKQIKDKDLKHKVEKKREDEKPPYKDRYQENKTRDKPVVKPSRTSRQKPIDVVNQRSEDRRSAEDLRKKPHERGTDSQDYYGNSRRGNAVNEPRKIPNKYRDKEQSLQGSSRFKERERKTGRDYDGRKNVREDPKKSSSKERHDSDTLTEQENKLSTTPIDMKLKTRRYSEMTNTANLISFLNPSKEVIQRRYSLENDYIDFEGHDSLTNSKPFRKSADNIDKLKKYRPKIAVIQHENSKKPFPKYTRDVRREPQKPNQRRYRDNEPTKTRTSPRTPKDPIKVRRSSLESGNSGTERAAKEAPPIRRNHSLELESDSLDDDRSRETSVVSSNDGEDKRLPKQGSGGDAKKDPRPERRIRNKDRPSIEIYRPGMGRFSKQRIDRDKE